MTTNKKTINVYNVISCVKKDTRNIAKYCIIGAVIGVIVAFSIPKIYKTNVTLAPEASNANSLGSGLSSMASLVGLNKNILGSDDAIFPEIYPDLVSSTDFIISLFPIKVKSIDGKINTTYYDYIETKQKITWWSYPMAWVKAIVKKIKKDGKPKEDNNKIDPFRLTRDQFEIAQAIGNNIECDVDKKTSVISITVTDQDPLISATIADSAKARLQYFITNYKTNKARNDLRYMENLFSEAKEDYVKARQKYAEYSDANQELLLQAYKLQSEELENDMQLRYNIYSQVAEQLQLAKSKVQERTPAFTVLQSATVPIKHSNKPKILTMLTYMVLAFAIRIGIIIYRNKDSVFENLFTKEEA